MAAHFENSTEFEVTAPGPANTLGVMRSNKTATRSEEATDGSAFIFSNLKRKPTDSRTWLLNV